MNTINSKISIILIDLIFAIKNNDIEQAKTLVDNLNELLPQVEENNANLSSLFSIDLLDIKNETLIYILENLPTLFPDFSVWDVRYNFLIQGTQKTYAKNWIQKLIDENKLNDLSLGEVKQIFEICIKYQLFDLMQQVRNIFNFQQENNNGN